MKAVMSFAAACMLLAGATMWAQTVDEYQGYMKSNAAQMMELNKNLMAKDGKAAMMNVRNVQENMAKVNIYWQIKNSKDGTRFSLDTDYALRQTGVLITENKFDEATASLKAVQAQCAGCHMAHREKQADGSFKIK